MTWITGEVDGVTIKRRSIVGLDGWAAAKDAVIALMVAQLSDRFNMGDSIADSFADSGDVAGGVCTSGYVKNTETAAVPAQSAANIVPVLTSNTSASGYVASASTEFADSYGAWKAFDGVLNDFYNQWSSASGDTAGYLQIKIPSAKVVDSYAIVFRDYDGQDPTSWSFQGSNNGSSWVTLDSRSGISPSSRLEKKTFSFTNSSSYTYYRLNITANAGSVYTAVIELEIYSKAIAYQPAYPNPMTITVTPYTPDNTLEKVRVTLMLQDMNNTGALAVGSSSSDLIQAYLSYDGNSSFGSALGFSEEPEEFTAGSNIYVFNSNEVDVSAETISSLGLKLQSFDRGSGAPAFRWHAYIIAGKESA